MSEVQLVVDSHPNYNCKMKTVANNKENHQLQLSMNASKFKCKGSQVFVLARLICNLSDVETD